MMEHLAQILSLRGVAVAVVIAFQRLHIPTSLGYLLVRAILGPHTAGPTVYVPELKALAKHIRADLIVMGTVARRRAGAG
jgi:CPA2 family monovalent cation:H+ antiporter-2